MLMNRDHVGIEVIPMIRDIIDLKELNSKVKTSFVWSNHVGDRVIYW